MWRIESNLVLIPIWLYRCLPNGTKLTSIMGNEKVIGRDEIDTDIRGGCMAFGLIIED